METRLREQDLQNFQDGAYYNQTKTEEFVIGPDSLNSVAVSAESFSGGETEAGDTVQYQDGVSQPNPVFRKAIRWIIYVVTFLVPLWFLPFSSDILDFNKQTLLFLAAGLGLVLYLVDIIKSGVIRYKPSKFYLPVFGLAAASVISVIFSVNRTISLFGVAEGRSASLFTISSLVVIFFLAMNVIEDNGLTLKKILKVSLVLAFIFGILQILGLFIFKGVFASRSFYSLNSLNALGIIAAISLACFSSYGLVGNRQKYEKSIFKFLSIFSHLGFVLAVFIIVLINWWPVWLVAFTSLLASTAFASTGSRESLKIGKMRLFAIPMAIIVLGIFLVLVNFSWKSFKSKLPIEIAPSQKTSWGIALSSLKTKPLGFGAENFGIAYDKFKPASVANSIFYQVRFTDGVSEAVNTAVEGGIPAILAFLSFLWFFMKEIIAKVKKGFGANDDAGVVWASSVGVVVAYFIYPFGVTTMSLLIMLLAIGLLTDPEKKERIINLESDAKYSFVGSLAFIVGLVLVLVAGYFTVNNYIANVWIARAQKVPNRDAAIERYVEASNNNPNDARIYRLLSQTIVAQLAENLKNGPQKDETREAYNSKIQNGVAAAVNVAIRATTVDSSDSRNWSNRGLVYENLLTLVGGADQAAISTYKESLARNPADPNTYLRIGNVYLAMADNLQRAINSRATLDYAAARNQIESDLKNAGENYEKAVSLYNNFGQALYNLAVVYDRQNKLSEAIKQFEKLRASNPRDPSIAFQIGLLYYRNNQKDSAFTAWQQAVILFPNYSNARWYLSLVYEERGDLVNALKQVEEIERFNPENETVKQRLTQLRSGERIIPPERVLDQAPLNQ